MDDNQLHERTIKARSDLESRRGKTRFFGKNDTALDVEDLALEVYESEGYRGIRSENEYWWQIMVLLYWDVIFARLPGVSRSEVPFPSASQDLPYDMFRPEFFERRKAQIALRHRQLERRSILGLGKSVVERELRRSWQQHFGQPCRLMGVGHQPRWSVFSVDDLAWGASALTAKQLCAVMDRLLRNFVENRRGLPDLFLIIGGNPLFVEVKQRNEKIRPEQTEWLLWLSASVGVAVEICRVHRT